MDPDGCADHAASGLGRGHRTVAGDMLVKRLGRADPLVSIEKRRDDRCHGHPARLPGDCQAGRGKELSGHAQVASETGTRVFFADPHSPWQRPTNKNTNGLLRQYFPKGTDPVALIAAEDLEAVAAHSNNRPRKILGWKTPRKY